MAVRRGILAAGAAAAVILIAVGLWLWRGRTSSPPLPEPQQITVPDSVPVEDVDLASPDLDVVLVGLRPTVHADYTDWACLLECRERDGCRADVEVTVDYRSAGQAKTLAIGGTLDGAGGEIMRVGRAQRPPVTVDGIDRVTLKVIEVHRSNVPRPTEIE